MIYITGDTHGNFDRFSKKRLRKKALNSLRMIMYNDKIIDEKHTLLYYAIVGLEKKLLMLFLFLENLNIRITIQ